MNLDRSRIYLATIAPDAAQLARQNGLGLEIDEFCTAMNLDADFDRWDAQVRGHLEKTDRAIFHAPFSELSPCAVDPMVRQVTRYRLDQAARLCQRYGIRRMVVHTGFIPRTYYPVWFVEQASAFFREFLMSCPADFELLIENVLDPDPQPIRDMAQAIGDPRAGLCLDVGHANVASDLPIDRWLNALAPLIRHYHIHDNDGLNDLHHIPGHGFMGYPDLFGPICTAAPEATMTFECSDAAACVQQLEHMRILE